MSARTTNTMTLATGSTTPAIYGNWINGTGTTLTGTGTLTFAGRGTQTITSAGKTFTQPLLVMAVGGEVLLNSALQTNGGLSILIGAFRGNGYNLTTIAYLLSDSSNTRTLDIGSGTWTSLGSGTNAFSCNPSTGATVTGTGTISLTSASAKTFTGSGIAYTDITLNQGGAGTLTITGNNTFKDITNTYKATGATAISLDTTTQRVSQWTAAGEVGRVLTVQGLPGTLVHTGAGDISVDYLTITGVRAYPL